jgi:hypothetical protein
MGYYGKRLGINGQGMTNPIQIERIACYVRLGYGKEGYGEYFKISEVREASN